MQRTPALGASYACSLTLVVLLAASLSTSCSHDSIRAEERESETRVVVGVTKVTRHALVRRLTVSAELVPFQEIDVYAKESGFVKRLLVDYGTHVKQGQLLGVLEIPELQATVRQDEAALKSVADQVRNAENQLSRAEAQHTVMHLEFERLNEVAKGRPGLVAQQEVDDVQARDLAGEAQVEAARSNVAGSKSNLNAAQAKLEHDEDLSSYTQITAPFAGVITQRYANLGTLLQAGTSSSTQAIPLVKLSQEDLFRLVIPVPESYVGFLKTGDAVDIHVPALEKQFSGKIARFALDVHDATRTMHTEVDVPNTQGVLIPGLYAEATLTLNKAEAALTVPEGAIDRSGEKATVFIVDGENKIASRQVELGMDTETEVEVLSGLREGDQVVVSERDGLKVGQPIRMRGTTPLSDQSKG